MFDQNLICKQKTQICQPFLKKVHYIFQKEGGGRFLSNAVWRTSENASNFVAKTFDIYRLS